MPNHEQAVIDGFNSFFQQRATNHGKRVRTLALDGQDSIAGADYLLTDENRFALVEFKFSEENIIDEKRKSRRLELCRQLAKNQAMRELHDRTHFIAYSDGSIPLSVVHCNVYRLEVCNQKIFGPQSQLKDRLPVISGRVNATQFIDEFLERGSRRSLALSNFEEYLEWLLTKASGSHLNSLELLMSDENPDEFHLLTFSSIRSAYNWMRRQKTTTR